MAEQLVINGGADLRRTLRATEPLVDKALRRELVEIGGRIALVGASRAPRRTGALQRSIRPYVTARGVAIGSTLPYAGVVHWGGTIRPRGAPITFRPRPFLSDATEDVADWALEQITEAFDRAVISAGWKP